MLHPARRLWRWRTTKEDVRTCRLTRRSSETLLRPRARRRRARLRDSRRATSTTCAAAMPRPLEAVLEHNRLDLLSLALVTARAAQLLEDGPRRRPRAREALGLGSLYERAGLLEEALQAFRRAVALERCGRRRRVQKRLRARAVLWRRLRRFDEAAERGGAVQSSSRAVPGGDCPRGRQKRWRSTYEHRRAISTRRDRLRSTRSPSGTVARRQAVDTSPGPARAEDRAQPNANRRARRCFRSDSERPRLDAGGHRGRSVFAGRLGLAAPAPALRPGLRLGGLLRGLALLGRSARRTSW